MCNRPNSSTCFGAVPVGRYVPTRPVRPLDWFDATHKAMGVSFFVRCLAHFPHEPAVRKTEHSSEQPQHPFVQITWHRAVLQPSTQSNGTIRLHLLHTHYPEDSMEVPLGTRQQSFSVLTQELYCPGDFCSCVQQRGRLQAHLRPNAVRQAWTLSERSGTFSL